MCFNICMKGFVSGKKWIWLYNKYNDAIFSLKQVVLTNPAESLALIDFGYYLPSSGFTQIAISPNVMDTSEDLRHYSSNERHCLYPHERQLEFFQTYTQDNCKLECLSKFTLNKCACVAFYMPRKSDCTTSNIE